MMSIIRFGGYPISPSTFSRKRKNPLPMPLEDDDE
jgi:hypothetical protein